MDNTLQQFSELNIPEELKKSIKELGYISPTDFQRGVFENFREGKNVFGDGQSSYGKSLAFSLPILSAIATDEPTTQALIVCETATQSDLCAKECKALGRHAKITVSNSVTSNGLGAPKPHVLIWSFDELLKAQVNDIAETIRTVFFDGLSSSNMTKAMEILAGLFNRGVQVLVFGQEAIDTCKTNKQEVFSEGVVISNNDQPKITAPAVHIYHQAKDTEPKPKALLAALLLHKPRFALVTANESQECDLLARYLARHGFKTAVVSEENNRAGLKEALKEGIDGVYDVLLCQNTLIAGQSLEHVAFMINYDMFDRPQAYEQTTQFNKQAPGLTRSIVNIVSPMELGFLGPIKAQCLIPLTEMPLPSQTQVMDLCVSRIVDGLTKEASQVELGQYEELSQKFLAHPNAVIALSLLLRNHLSMPVKKPAPSRDRDYEPRDRRGGRSFNERYQRPNNRDTRGSEPAANSVAETQERTPPRSEDGVSRLYLTLGRADGFSDLTALAQYVSDTSKVDLGHFSGGGMIRDTSAHIEVDDDVAEEVIKALHDSARPDAQEGDAPVVCERARGIVRDRPRSRYPQQRRRPNFQRR